MEAISHAGAALGILAKDGVILAAEKLVTSKLLDPGTTTEKLYILDDHVSCVVSGITADANILVRLVNGDMNERKRTLRRARQERVHWL